MQNGIRGKRWPVLAGLAIAIACESTSSNVDPGDTAGSANGGASGSGQAVGGASGGASATAGALIAGSGADAASGGMAATSGAAGGDGGAGEDAGGDGGASAGSSGGGDGPGGGSSAGAGIGGGGGGPSGGGGGGPLPTCGTVPSGTTIQGCILDAAGVKSTTLAKTPVTVVRIGGGDASGCSTNTNLTTEIRLRAADSREWSYFVYLPDRPLDQVQVGDALDLSVAVYQPHFFDQTIVLGRGSDLVLFSVVSWMPNVPDLSAYGTSVAIGAPYCVGSGICGSTQFKSLHVTRAAESAELQTGQRKTVASLLVSLEVLSQSSGLGCDPPTAYRYGGFVPRVTP